MTKSDFVNLYSETKYIIPELELTIEIGKSYSLLDNLLEMNSYIHWAFISASNPFSVETSDLENEQLFERLFEQVKANYKLFYLGFGQGQDGWKDEKSILILGISKSKAIELGKLFRQNAIVIGAIGSKTELLWLEK